MSTARTRQRGSVLLLVPAAVLIVVMLGAIAVDAAVVFLGQRELGSATAAAANDAAGAAFAHAAFYEEGRVELDVDAAQRVAAASLAARRVLGVEVVGEPQITISGRQLCVEVEGRVRRIFGTAIPGVSASVVVRARSVATLAGDPATPQRGVCAGA